MPFGLHKIKNERKHQFKKTKMDNVRTCVYCSFIKLTNLIKDALPVFVTSNYIPISSLLTIDVLKDNCELTNHCELGGNWGDLRTLLWALTNCCAFKYIKTRQESSLSLKNNVRRGLENSTTKENNTITHSTKCTTKQSKKHITNNHNC